MMPDEVRAGATGAVPNSVELRYEAVLTLWAVSCAVE